MARKTWPHPCSAGGVVEECTVMSSEATISPEAGSECRALIVVAPVRSGPAERPQAAFVTQLIACERRIGTYRTARRASSADAASLYVGRLEAASRSFQRIV